MEEISSSTESQVNLLYRVIYPTKK